jgi:hypothetical protein
VYKGDQWAGFDPAVVIVISASAEPVEELTVLDVDTAQPIQVAVATTLGPSPSTTAAPTTAAATTTTTVQAVTTVAPTTAAPTTAAPTTAPATTVPATAPVTTPAPTTAPPTVVDAAGEGEVSASSQYDASFSPALATDGDPTTSWFSAGSIVDGDESTFTWQNTQDDLITEITIVSNANHEVPEFRRNFGFDEVSVAVLDASGQVVFESTVPLPGTPDPDVSVRPGARGATVSLTFKGHEAPDCGGFSELQVLVAR